MGRVLRATDVEGSSDIDRAIGQVLRRTRNKYCWSIEHLAAIVDISAPMLGNYENGKNRLRLSLLRKISHALGLNPVLVLAEAQHLIACDVGDENDIETGEGLSHVIDAFLRLQTPSDRRRFRCLLVSFQAGETLSCDAANQQSPSRACQLN